MLWNVIIWAKTKLKQLPKLILALFKKWKSCPNCVQGGWNKRCFWEVFSKASRGDTSYPQGSFMLIVLPHATLNLLAFASRSASKTSLGMAVTLLFTFAISDWSGLVYRLSPYRNPLPKGLLLVSKWFLLSLSDHKAWSFSIIFPLDPEFLPRMLLSLWIRRPGNNCDRPFEAQVS